MNIKKFTSIAIILSFATISAFAQEDAYAKLQGVWYTETKDGSTYFIFENNTVIFTGEEIDVGTVNFCKFMLSSNKIIFYLNRAFWFSNSKWQSTTPDEEEFDGIFECNYVFSSDKLILIFDDTPLALSKMD